MYGKRDGRKLGVSNEMTAEVERLRSNQWCRPCAKFRKSATDTFASAASVKRDSRSAAAGAAHPSASAKSVSRRVTRSTEPGFPTCGCNSGTPMLGTGWPAKEPYARARSVSVATRELVARNPSRRLGGSNSNTECPRFAGPPCEGGSLCARRRLPPPHMHVYRESRRLSECLRCYLARSGEVHLCHGSSAGREPPVVSRLLPVASEGRLMQLSCEQRRCMRAAGANRNEVSTGEPEEKGP